MDAKGHIIVDEVCLHIGISDWTFVLNFVKLKKDAK